MVSYNVMYWTRKRIAYHEPHHVPSPPVPIRRYKRRVPFMVFLEGLLDWENGGMTEKCTQYKRVMQRRKRKRKYLTNGNMLDHYRENVR